MPWMLGPDRSRRRGGHSLALLITLVLGVAGLGSFWAVLARVALTFGYLGSPRRVELMEENTRYGFRVAPTSETLEAWRGQLRAYDALVGYAVNDVVVRVNDVSRVLPCAEVDPALAMRLGLDPVVGRSFDSMATPPERSVVLVTSEFARGAYGAPDIALGKTLAIDGEPAQVIGVVPGEIGDRIGPGDAIAVVRPIDYARAETVAVIGFLRQGVTVREAQMELDAWARSRPPSSTQDGEVHWVALARSDLMDSQTLRMVRVVLVAAVVLLLVTISTVAHLLGARAAGQRKELATRWAVGATRTGLIAAATKRTLTVTALGSLAGCVLANGALGRITRSLPHHLRFLHDLRIDPGFGIAAFSLTTAVVVGFGMAPVVLRGARTLGRDLGSDRSSATSSRPVGLLDQAHIVTVVACCLLLCVATYRSVGTVAELLRPDFGFERDGLVSLEVQVPPWKFDGPASRTAALAPLVASLSSHPQVESFAIADQGPSQPGVLLGHVEHTGDVEERDLPSPLGRSFVGAGYFETLHQRIVAGRGFADAELGSNAPVAIVSESLARRIARRPQAALGQALRFGDQTREIIGVVGDVRTPGLASSLKHLHVYLPLSGYRSSMTVLVRLRSDLRLDLGPVRAALDPDVAVDAAPIEAVLDESIADVRFLADLFSLMAALSVLLAFLGVHSILSDFIDRHRPQIALRIAVGATGADVQRWVVWKGISRSLVGVGLGLAASYPVDRLFGGHFFPFGLAGLGPRLAAGAAISAVTLAATWLPAARASHTSPAQTLKGL